MDRTFSETLIAEWLQLDEWAVRTGVPLGAKESGGRDEADIIGLKIVGNIPRIIHIEVGSLGGSLSENIARLDAKFTNDKKRLINKELGLNGTDVEQRYIATWLSSNINEIRAKGHRIDMLYDVIQDEILPSLFAWKLKRSKGRKTDQLPTPPNNLWFMQLLEYVAIWGVDLSPYWNVKRTETREWILTDSGVKVYKKPKYHPYLKGTDLKDPDFLNKQKEVFKRGKASNLPKICSENSEDALTWHYFSPLKTAADREKERWIREFIRKAFGKNVDKGFNNLGEAEVMLWRGKEVEPYMVPPKSYPRKEGKTEVDVILSIPSEAIIFVEAKYKSPISKRTTHDPERDQIIRNIDVGTNYANENELDFYFVMLTRENDRRSKHFLDQYRKNVKKIVSKLSHRANICIEAQSIANAIGYLTWKELSKITLKS